MNKSQAKPVTKRPLTAPASVASRVSTTDYGTIYGYLIIQNAVGFVGTFKIQIDNAGLVCVLGNNLESAQPSSSGAGKSRMWKLMLYLIYGRKALGSVESIKDSMILGRDFRIEFTVKRHGQWYLVRECHNHSDKRYKEGLAVYKINDGKLVPWGSVNDPNMLRAKLQALIGMTYNEMLGTTIWPQDFAHILISGKPQERITFLSELYGLTRFDDVYKYLDGLHQEVKAKIEKLLEFKGEYRVVEEAINQTGNIKQIQEKAIALRELISTHEAKASLKRSDLTEIHRKIDRLQEMSDHLDEFHELEISDHERSLLSSGQLLSTFDTSCIEVNKKLDRYVQLNDAWTRLSALKTSLDKLDVKSYDLASLKAEQNKLNSIVIPSYSRQARWSREEIDTLAAGADALKKKVIDYCKLCRVKPDAQSIKAAYSTIKQRLDETTADMRSVGEQHSSLRNLVSDLKGNSSSCKCPTCLQDIDYDATERVIEDLQKRADKLDETCIKLEDSFDLIEKLFNDFSNWSKLKVEAADAVASIEALDKLDAANARVASIGKIIETAERHRRLFDEAAALELKLKDVDTSKLAKGVAYYTKLVEDNDQRRQDYYHLEQVTTRIKASAAALKIEDPFTIDVVTDLSNLTAERDRIENWLSRANTKISEEKVQLDRFKQLINDYRQKKDHLTSLKSKMDELHDLEDREVVIAKTKPAYSKNGFKREGLKKLLQALSERLPYWTRMLFTEKNFSVAVHGDERKLSLTAPKVFTIEGKKKTQIVDVSALSGGEKSRLAVCLMLTMSELVAKEKRSNLLVLDEVDRGLDPYAQRLMAEIFIPKMRKKKSGLFVISHSQVIDPNSFDRKLVVTKHKTGLSEISVHENRKR